MRTRRKEACALCHRPLPKYMAIAILCDDCFRKWKQANPQRYISEAEVAAYRNQGD